MRLRPEFKDERTCAVCGAMAQRLGTWENDEAEGGWYFQPKPLYVSSFSDHPLAEPFKYTRMETVRGIEKEVEKVAYFLRYEFYCSRPSKPGKMGEPFDYECGVLLRKHTNPVVPGDDIPAFCYEVSDDGAESLCEPCTDAPAPEPTQTAFAEACAGEAF